MCLGEFHINWRHTYQSASDVAGLQNALFRGLCRGIGLVGLLRCAVEFLCRIGLGIGLGLVLAVGCILSVDVICKYVCIFLFTAYSSSRVTEYKRMLLSGHRPIGRYWHIGDTWLWNKETTLCAVCRPRMTLIRLTACVQKSDIMAGHRKLRHDGHIKWMSARGKPAGLFHCLPSIMLRAYLLTLRCSFGVVVTSCKDCWAYDFLQKCPLTRGGELDPSDNGSRARTVCPQPPEEHFDRFSHFPNTLIQRACGVRSNSSHWHSACWWCDPIALLIHVIVKQRLYASGGFKVVKWREGGTLIKGHASSVIQSDCMSLHKINRVASSTANITSNFAHILNLMHALFALFTFCLNLHWV